MAFTTEQVEISAQGTRTEDESHPRKGLYAYRTTGCPLKESMFTQRVFANSLEGLGGFIQKIIQSGSLGQEGIVNSNPDSRG